MKCCSRCRTVSDGTVCPECGGSAMFVPQSSDLVFIAECDPFMGDILEGMLNRKNIAVTKNSGISEYSAEGVVTHFGMDKFYVAFSDYEEANAVIRGLYSPE